MTLSFLLRVAWTTAVLAASIGFVSTYIHNHWVLKVINVIVWILIVIAILCGIGIIWTI
jgi:hypothetical protein